MFRALIVSVVSCSSRRPWLILALALVCTVIGAFFVTTHFAINTDITKLISPNLPWRQREIAYAKAFSNQETAILAVLDAPTPELAQSAATRLTQTLSERRDYIRAAYQLQGGQFFRRNGLLFLSADQLNQTLRQLSGSAMLLSPLASDPSLRGVMDAITLSLRAVRAHRVTLNSLAPMFNALSDANEKVLQGKPASFSWRTILNGQPATTSDLRRLINIYPILDFTALEPGEKPTAAIRQAVADLKLPAEGVSVRLTGQVRISDEEFGTLEQDAPLDIGITIVAVLIILWMALHSFRIILAVFISLIAGLAITAAGGLAWVGAFNPISVAFFILFVGIGVDFGLQFSVAYRAERHEKPGLFDALVATASGTGGRLALAALATAAGFLSFLPTAYRGLSELGEIAGLGMIVAFLMSITVLPALLRLLNPPAEPHPLGYAFLAPLDRFLERHRIAVLVITLCAVGGASPLLYWLQFDLNPMHLRSPKVESVATYYDLQKNPDTKGPTAEILEPSLQQADALAKKLSALPEVSRTVTLSSFIPEDQDKKLQMISQTANQLNPVLNPQQTKPKPSDQDVVQSLGTAADALRSAAGRSQGAGSEAASRLANILSQLAKADPAARAKAEEVLIVPLKITLDNLRESLNPEKVTLATLPPSLASDWVTADGRARISVTPKGNAGDTAVLRRFVDAVLSVAPNATGEAVGIEKGGETIIYAFAEAAFWALLSIAILLLIFLRRITDVFLTLFPLILAGIVTLELVVAFGMKLNFANIIALPLLLGIGVAFKIYYITAWREGRSGLLASPLTRAVFFSGLTTAVAFGSLWLSNHPGTSSMGQLLALSLACTMAAAVLFQPLLMGPPRKKI